MSQDDGAPTIPDHRKPPVRQNSLALGSVVAVLVFIGAVAATMILAGGDDEAPNAQLAGISGASGQAASPILTPTGDPVPQTRPLTFVDADRAVAEFGALVAPFGFEADGTVAGDFFDVCGGPTDREVTAHLFANGTTTLVVAPHPSIDRAMNAFTELEEIAPPCAAFPDMFLEFLERSGANTIRLRYGFEGDPDSYYDLYKLRANVIAAVITTDPAEIEQFDLMFTAWVPGTLPLPPPAAAAPTARATATALPTPTPRPIPTVAPTPRPIPTPQPTVGATTFEPRTLPAGRNTIQLNVLTTFELAGPRPAQLLPGHTAVYLDDSLAGEVDLFVPYATGDGQVLRTFDDVIAHVETDPLFSEMQKIIDLDDATYPAVAYFGFPPELEVGFFTAPGTFDIAEAGWRMPGRLTLWIIDAPGGPIAVTGETLLADADRDGDAQELLTEIFASIEFHPS